MIDPLVDPEVAKAHLKLDYDPVELITKLQQASSIVLRHMKLEDWPDDWILETSPESSPAAYEVPGDIQAATLLVLGELFLNREGVGDPLSKTVVTLLGGRRTPSMA
jgi:hypothetical protein